jgi:hypothetical protein
MPLVEGIRGPDSVRWCELCQEHTLQMVGVFYTDAALRAESLPSEWSHMGPHCPVCEDKIEKGEIDVGPTGELRESA